MAVLKNTDGTEMLVDCNCGCDNGIRFRIDKEDFDYYCFMSYTNGKFYAEQGETAWHIFCKKLKKIRAIIRNKDFYYTEMMLTKDEFNEFREYINSIE
jgi:hypothetical protein